MRDGKYCNTKDGCIMCDRLFCEGKGTEMEENMRVELGSVRARMEDYEAIWMNACDSQGFPVIPAERLEEIGFFTAPASTKFHGAYEGGLYDHSRTVTMELIRITQMMGLKWERHISPFVVGMYHDLCKCDQYRRVLDSRAATEGSAPVGYVAPDLSGKSAPYEFNDKTILKGHGAKSILILAQFMTLTEEELLCIRYMGAYEKEEWNEFDAAIRKYPNVLWTHTADMVASKVYDT